MFQKSVRTLSGQFYKEITKVLKALTIDFKKIKFVNIPLKVVKQFVFKKVQFKLFIEFKQFVFAVSKQNKLY